MLEIKVEIPALRKFGAKYPRTIEGIFTILTLLIMIGMIGAALFLAGYSFAVAKNVDLALKQAISSDARVMRVGLVNYKTALESAGCFAEVQSPAVVERLRQMQNFETRLAALEGKNSAAADAELRAIRKELVKLPAVGKDIFWANIRAFRTLIIVLSVMLLMALATTVIPGKQRKGSSDGAHCEIRDAKPA